MRERENLFYDYHAELKRREREDRNKEREKVSRVVLFLIVLFALCICVDCCYTLLNGCKSETASIINMKSVNK